MDEARRHFEKALRLSSRLPSGRALRMAEVHNDLGFLGKCTGELAAGVASYQQAWALLETAPRSRQRQLVRLALCHNLGGILHAQGRLDDAAEWARRGLRLRRRGDDDRGRLADEAALAAILIDQGQLDEAGRVLSHAQTLFRRLGADAQGERNALLHNRAALAERRGDRKRACALYRQALDGPPPRSASTRSEQMITRFCLARLLSDMGSRERTEARRLLTRVRKYAVQHWSTTHPVCVALSSWAGV